MSDIGSDEDDNPTNAFSRPTNQTTTPTEQVGKHATDGSTEAVGSGSASPTVPASRRQDAGDELGRTADAKAEGSRRSTADHALSAGAYLLGSLLTAVVSAWSIPTSRQGPDRIDLWDAGFRDITMWWLPWFIVFEALSSIAHHHLRWLASRGGTLHGLSRVQRSAVYGYRRIVIAELILGIGLVAGVALMRTTGPVEALVLGPLGLAGLVYLTSRYFRHRNYTKFDGYKLWEEPEEFDEDATFVRAIWRFFLGARPGLGPSPFLALSVFFTLALGGTSYAIHDGPEQLDQFRQSFRSDEAAAAEPLITPTTTSTSLPAPTAPPTTTQAPIPAPPTATSVPPPTIIVEPGDSFWKLATQYCPAPAGDLPSVLDFLACWRDLIDVNRHLLEDQSNPDLIFPDQRFTLPME